MTCFFCWPDNSESRIPDMLAGQQKLEVLVPRADPQPVQHSLCGGKKICYIHTHSTGGQDCLQLCTLFVYIHSELTVV